MGSTFRVAALATALSIIGCSSLEKVQCQPGYALCDGACTAVRTDPQHCGACGHACLAREVCAAGACVADCRSSLHAPVVDSWGIAWDGLERPQAPYRDARSACFAIGGRLPTASELFRVSAAASAEVGDIYATNGIWALTPLSSASAVYARLSTGAVADVAMTSQQGFRCVCPPALPADFSGDACYGPPGAGCHAPSYDARHHLDAENRPALPKAGALWECSFYGGRLPTLSELAAAAIDRLPHSAGQWVFVEEDDALESSAVLRFDAAGAVSAENVPTATALPFRCIGVAGDQGVAATVAGGARAARGNRVLDGADRAAAGFTAALADCFAAGGHLPARAELAALAQQGLRREASGAYLWTADQMGANGTGALAAAYRWSGTVDWVDTVGSTAGLGYSGTPPMSWSYKTTGQQPYRCVYHPVDPSVRAPAACTDPCWTRTLREGATVWIDGADRQAKTFYTASAECAALGGHLATARDLVEGIRGGLRGWNTAVMAASSPGLATALRLTWSGTSNEGFLDTAADAVPFATPAPFRCAWTTELR